MDNDIEEKTSTIMRTAIFTGSFDPFTIGHASIVRRALPLFDRLIIGNDDSGESCLLVCEGSATDLSIDSVYFVDRFYSGRQMWYCGSFRNAALQMVILFPGDLPNCMLRYRDAQGEHELLIGQSGYDGSILLTENDFSVQG